MAEDYVLVKGPPSAEHALPRGACAFHCVHRGTQETVAMGRAIGDGLFYQIVDMACSPAHQRKGLGDRILKALMAQIAEEAPAGVYVSLMADPPGRALYKKNGFVADPPETGSLGMWVSPAKR